MIVIIGDNIFTAYFSVKKKLVRNRYSAALEPKQRPTTQKKPNKALLGAALIGLSKRYSFLH